MVTETVENRIKMPWKFFQWVATNLFRARSQSQITIQDDDGRVRSRSRSRNRTRSRSRSVAAAGQDLKLKNLEKVLKELECPICFNTCIPPIYTCLNGHMICTPCRRKNVHCCPTCREGFSGTRNLFAEQFIQQYSQPCKFVKDGCQFLKWKGDDMKPHERGCYYRHVNCMVPSCQQNQIRYRNLLDHLIDTHKIHGSDHIPVLISYHTEEPLIADRKWLPYYILAHDCTFYVMMEVLRPHFWAWVWVHYPREELANKCEFTASLQFVNEEKKISMDWTGPVYSIRTPANVITQEGLCFGAAEAVMQHFEKDGLISVNVNIHKSNECLDSLSRHSLSAITRSSHFIMEGACGGGSAAEAGSPRRRRVASTIFASVGPSNSTSKSNLVED